MKRIVFLLLLLVGLQAHGQVGGDARLSVTIDGKTITLYTRSAAFLVGMADYTTGWPALPGIRQEIDQVKTILEKQGFLIKTLINPTKEQLTQSFSDFISLYGKQTESRIIFFYAGHGTSVKTIYGDELGYIVPANAPNPNDDLAKFLSNSIEMEVLETFARDIQAKHALFLFDACFTNPILKSNLVSPRGLDNRSILPARQFITTGSGNDESIRQGLFVEQFRKALDGDADKDSDDYLTGTELANYLQVNILSATSYSLHPQYGEIRDPELSKGDFVFPLRPVSPPKTEVVVEKKTEPPKPPPVIVSKPATTEKKIEPVIIKPAEDYGIKMAFVQGGEFLMGSIRGSGAESPVHKVRVGNYYIAINEITQKQYRDITGTNPSAFIGCDECPVDRISYDEAVAFIAKLNEKTGKKYRLPTEAEWEYAAQGGNLSHGYRYCGGNDLDLVSWNVTNAGKKTHPVGTKYPNELGLYDMSGNILEWCNDWFDDGYYRTKTYDNPKGPLRGDARSVRGGSWKHDGSRMTTTYRWGLKPQVKYADVGFRVVREE